MSQPLLSAAFLQFEDGREISLSDVLITHPAFIIGSDPRAHLRLALSEAAPAHAAVSLRGSSYIIQPRYPNLKLMVNGLPVKAPKPLRPGDRVQIGSVTLTFVQTDEQIAIPTPQLTESPDALPSVVTLGAISPNRATEAPTASMNIHYPQSGSVTANSPSRLVAAVGVLAVVVVMAFGISSRITPAMAAAPTSNQIELYYDDGNATLIMFDATWCQYCKQQKPTVEKLAADFRGDVYVTYIDIDTGANAELVAQYSATSIPRIVVLDDKGRIVNEFYGVQAETVLRQAVQSALTASNIN
jgi:thiol-disulfide isomerase/thioredoxin